MIPISSPAHEATDPLLFLAEVRAVVEPEVRKAVGRLPASARAVAGYHLGWVDPQGAPVSEPAGKFLRPALVLLACEGAGGRQEQALPAAIAVELVHSMSLLHDDVIDGDALRRHRRTAWSVFGLPAAILTGDALLSLAGRVLFEAAAPLGSAGPALLDDAVQQLVEGEFADTLAEERDQVPLVDGLATAAAKTGALIALSCVLGALAAGAGPTQVAHLRRFGYEVGAAFQLTDDILGIWGDPQVTGKPARSDLRARKKSLPVIAALSSPHPASEELELLYRSPGELSEVDLVKAAELVEAAGGRAWAEREAHLRIADALSSLEAAALTGPAHDGLSALTRMITSRDR